MSGYIKEEDITFTNAYKMLVTNIKGRHHLGDLGIEGRK
jgi:hypothetical protein